MFYLQLPDRSGDRDAFAPRRVGNVCCLLRLVVRQDRSHSYLVRVFVLAGMSELNCIMYSKKMAQASQVLRLFPAFPQDTEDRLIVSSLDLGCEARR